MASHLGALSAWITAHVPGPLSYKQPASADNEGYWGPVTSTIDWCEENYVISPFFAEFVNSTTNLAFFALSMYHLHSAIKNKHGLLFMFVSVGMCFVGVGSWLFHMTLKYEFQLMDELPMIYCTALPFAYIFSVGKGKTVSVLIYSTTALFTALLTYIYCSVYQNPAFHQVSYGLLNFAIIFRSLYLVNTRVTDPKIRKFLYGLISAALFEFLFGFLLWNLDTAYCTNLIWARREVMGLPYGVVLEGHGWWHVFTGLGIYHFILYSQVLRTWVDGVQDNYELLWTYGFLGEVVLKQSDKIKTKKCE
ncbi:unnamed protein product [Kuraishia capsulata CBS 1993]|uniref:Alkaline ceramidase n=1 Tax=Kuraishia capsulata CBS 1993 TaxID=1382522 RepID=W6MFA0_9ASCO|nr:uncharacterized protein KUCA_T00000371001 [Kuraishia capsulata CBS 1993]CDK24409.1 unnamed protein product [Kuraishia capsulata CBS 1993]